MSEVISLIHADDHPVVREGIRALLATEAGLELLASVPDGAAAVEQALTLRPDVLLLDLNMPRQGGLAVIEQVKAAWPEAHILVLTSFTGQSEVVPALKAGATGYILKDSPAEALFRAIRDVHNGRSWIDPAVAQSLLAELRTPSPLPPTEEPLTEREVEVLRLVAGGLSNQEIADRLVVSERTVRTHVSNILGKLQLANRTQAALYALREGLATLEEVGQ